MIFAIGKAIILFVAILGLAYYWPTDSLAKAIKSPSYCITISIPLRKSLREEVSAIDLTIENASVVRIPRFPAGWGIKIQNYVDNTPTRIVGGATGSVADLRAEDLKCLFEIENNVPGTPPIVVTGTVYISTGQTERRLILNKEQLVLEKIDPGSLAAEPQGAARPPHRKGRLRPALERRSSRPMEIE